MLKRKLYKISLLAVCAAAMRRPVRHVSTQSNRCTRAEGTRRIRAHRFTSLSLTCETCTMAILLLHSKTWRISSTIREPSNRAWCPTACHPACCLYNRPADSILVVLALQATHHRPSQWIRYITQWYRMSFSCNRQLTCITLPPVSRAKRRARSPLWPEVIVRAKPGRQAPTQPIFKAWTDKAQTWAGCNRLKWTLG